MRCTSEANERDEKVRLSLHKEGVAPDRAEPVPARGAYTPKVLLWCMQATRIIESRNLLCSHSMNTNTKNRGYLHQHHQCLFLFLQPPNNVCSSGKEKKVHLWVMWVPSKSRRGRFGGFSAFWDVERRVLVTKVGNGQNEGGSEFESTFWQPAENSYIISEKVLVWIFEKAQRLN